MRGGVASEVGAEGLAGAGGVDVAEGLAGAGGVAGATRPGAGAAGPDAAGGDAATGAWMLGSRVAVIGAGSLLAGALGDGAGGVLLADVEGATSFEAACWAWGGAGLFAAGADGLMADVSEVVRLLGRADGWPTGAGAGSPVPVVRLRMRSI